MTSKTIISCEHSRKKALFIILLFLAGEAFAQGFVEKDVSLRHKDAQGREVVLAGTLTTPEGRAPRGGWPAMVLITGSGSQNRDEELLGHKPFEVIARYMAQQGVATLRCDDRGVGGSTGVYDDVTPFDFAADIEAEWQYLAHARHINSQKTGLLGHSEGGTLALMEAAENREVAFVVMLAGPGLTMRQTLLEQNADIFLQRGVPDSLVARRLDCMRDLFAATDSVVALRAAHPEDSSDRVKQLNLAFRPIIRRHAAGLDKEQKQLIGLTTQECYGWALTMASPYMQVMLNLDPADYIARLSCSLCAFNGDKDCQVNAGTNLARIEEVCDQHDITCCTTIFIQMNHLFQKCSTGAVEEYQSLGQSPDNLVLERLSAWLEKIL